MPLYTLTQAQCDLVAQGQFEAFKEQMRAEFHSGHTHVGISLQGLLITPENAASIMDCFQNLNIDEFSFVWTRINDESLRIVLEKLQGRTDLLGINLKRCEFSAEGYQLLFEFLKQNEHVISVGMGSQKLTDDKFAAFKDKVLATKLEFLDLSDNHLTDPSIQELAHIAKAGTITHLTIGSNATSANGIQRLAEIIRGSRIVEVDLDGGYTSEENKAFIKGICEENEKRVLTWMHSAKTQRQDQLLPQGIESPQVSSPRAKN